MRLAAFIAPVFLLVACAETGTLELAEPDGSSTDDASADDTDVPDGNGGGDDTDSDLPAGEVLSWTHAIADLSLLPTGQGFDLDGNGGVDNALGGLARLIGGALSGLVQGADTVGIVQTWGVLDGNNRVQIGILTGADADGDPADNFSGAEPFDISEGLLPSGRAEVVAPARLAPDGSFAGQIPAGSFTIAGFTLPTATDVFIAGTVTQETIAGQIGAAIPVQVITDLLDQNGLGFANGFVADAADVDSDADGAADAISLAVAFQGVPCTIAATVP